MGGMYDDEEMYFGDNYDDDEDYEMEFGRRKKKRKKCRTKKCRRARARRSRKYINLKGRTIMVKGRKRKIYRGKNGALYYRTRRGKTYIKGRPRWRRSRFGESSGGNEFGLRSTVCGEGQMMNPAWARGRKGTRPCIKTKVKVTRAMLQAIAINNDVNIYKMRSNGTPGNVMMSMRGLKYRLTKAGVDWRSQLGLPPVAGGGGGGGMIGPMPLDTKKFYGPFGGPNTDGVGGPLDTDYYAPIDIAPGPGMTPAGWKYNADGYRGGGLYKDIAGLAAAPDFVASGGFVGSRAGYLFKNGPQGQGYYKVDNY